VPAACRMRHSLVMQLLATPTAFRRPSCLGCSVHSRGAPKPRAPKRQHILLPSRLGA
jgi:hypothetical protein